MSGWQLTSPVTPAFLFALLLYGPIAAFIESLPRERWHEQHTIRGGLRSRVARSAPARDDSAPRCLWCARSVCAATAAGAAARQARPAPARACRASVPRSICWCCARGSGLAAPETATWWTRLQDASRRPSASAWPKAVRQGNAAWPHGAGARCSQGPAAPRPRRRRRRRAAGPGLMLWVPAYVGMGSNLQDPPARIEAAFEALDSLPQSLLISRSSHYSSRPMGGVAQPDFCNAVAGHADAA